MLVFDLFGSFGDYFIGDVFYEDFKFFKYSQVDNVDQLLQWFWEFVIDISILFEIFML